MLPVIIAAGAALASLFLSGCSQKEEFKISPDPARVPYQPKNLSPEIHQETFHRAHTFYRVEANTTFQQWVNKRNLLDRKIDLYYRQGERNFDVYVSRNDEDTIVYILNQKREQYPDLRFQIFYYNPGEPRINQLPEKEDGRRVLVF